MSRWYRRYVGTVNDPKFAEAALIAECSKSVVLATWDAILESASENNQQGQFKATPRNVAATLQEQHATVERVFKALAELEMIADGVVSKWRERQFESDSSTDRSRKHREKTSKIKDPEKSNGDATAMQRCATPPDTDSETDSETEKSSAVARPSARSGEDLRLLSQKVFEAAGEAMASQAIAPGLAAMTIPLMWIDEGADLERDILPAVTAVAAKRRGKGAIASWDYFTRPVAEAKARRMAGLPAVEVPAGSPTARTPRPAWQLPTRPRQLSRDEMEQRVIAEFERENGQCQ